MLNRVQIAAVGAAVLLVAGAANARGTGGPGFQRSEAAPPATQARMSAMHQAMQAQGDPQLASDGWLFVGGEAGWVRATQPATAPIVRAAEPAVQAYGEVAADGWEFVGGEAGWVRKEHRYEFKGGRLVHAHEPWCVASHDLPAPSKSPLPGQEQQWNLYPGA